MYGASITWFRMPSARKNFPIGMARHFYARGNNPQFRYMTHLTDYANRLMSIFNGGNHRAPVAVAYPAEFEWAGEAMPVERPVRLLTESQIDMDIVSFDHLKDALVIDNKLRILNETFEVLVIPYASYMPKAMMEILERLKQEGLRIILVDNLPENFDAAVKDGYEVSPLQELPKHLDDVLVEKLAQPFRELVYYHYEKDGNDYWLFFNESISEVVDTTVSIPSYPGKNGYAFDAYHNQVNELEVSQEGIALKLAPYETLDGYSPRNRWLRQPESRKRIRKEADRSGMGSQFCGSIGLPKLRIRHNIAERHPGFERSGRL